MNKIKYLAHMLFVFSCTKKDLKGVRRTTVFSPIPTFPWICTFHYKSPTAVLWYFVVFTIYRRQRGYSNYG